MRQCDQPEALRGDRPAIDNPHWLEEEKIAQADDEEEDDEEDEDEEDDDDEVEEDEDE